MLMFGEVHLGVPNVSHSTTTGGGSALQSITYAQERQLGSHATRHERGGVDFAGYGIRFGD